MPLFEVVILEQPTKKESEEGGVEKLIFGPKVIIARDPQSAAIASVLDEKIVVDKSRMAVLVRHFA